MKRAAIVGGLAFVLTACVPLPKSYPVPEQRVQAYGADPEPVGALASFNTVRGKDYIVSGVLEAPPGQTWRWTGPNPRFRLRIGSPENLNLVVRFAFPEPSHAPLLPIAVGYFVNDRMLQRVVYRKSGMLEFSKAVPPDWLRKDNDNFVRMEIDPVYVAAADKAKLGMVVAEIGFEAQR